MKDLRSYWIWLQHGMGFGSATDEVLAAFPSPEEMYSLGEREWRISGAVSPRQADRLCSYSPEESENIVRRCDDNGWTITTTDMPSYPKLLRRLRDVPLVLYSRGDLSALRGKLPIAVVGSRNASEQSMKIAQDFSSELAQAGAVVISGGALGVDSAAHTGALSAGGITVAVLGCGINVPYLMKNEALRNDISKRGALVSEFPPDTPVYKASFPMRNRIISGMTVATVVIQASEHSGSLVTAARAAEQGRDVFAFPGDVTNGDFYGANKLIKDGAKPIFCARDILADYAVLYPSLGIRLDGAAPKQQPVPQKSAIVPAVQQATGSPELPDRMSEYSKGVYSIMSKTPVHVDEIVKTSGFEPNKVFTALTELEICGFIKLLEGKRYIIQ